MYRFSLAIVRRKEEKLANKPLLATAYSRARTVAIGIVAIFATLLRHEKKGVGGGLFIFDNWLFPIGILLWPLVLLFSEADAKIQLQEKEERERREVQKQAERPEDLSPLIGSFGMVLTQLAPHGRVEIGQRQFEAVSESGYLPSQTEIVVTGISSFKELTVKKAESGSGGHR